MSLSAGTRLGPYEILGPIGAGGMGEVYRARDTRLGRDVAVKVLPEAFAQDADRLARFEREAKVVAALSHPNILAIHDVGTTGSGAGLTAGLTYIVTELLHGDTLRDRLKAGRVPARKAIDIATQIAHGLAAAHDKGVVHRDLKPENVFLLADGQVKILDFGLAKPAAPKSGDATETAGPATDPGAVMGTVGYMAPEQVRGQATDARTDLFALGVVLYEMLAGQRAFQRDTAAQTMTAILEDDPPDLSGARGDLPPALDRIVRHCLEKNASERFHSAHDVAFALDALSGSQAPASHEPVASQRSRWPVAASAALVVVIAAGAYALWARSRTESAPPMLAFEPKTWDAQFITNARFAPDGTILFSAERSVNQPQVYRIRPGSVASEPFGPLDTHLLSISSKGELAVIRGGEFSGHRNFTGTLAIMTMEGSVQPRLENVQEADWAPDGVALAVIRTVNGVARLEYPIGTILYQNNGGSLSEPRVSPDGTHVAFADHASFGDDNGTIRIVDRAGKTTQVSDQFFGIEGMAWLPDGHSVIFSASSLVGGQQILPWVLNVDGPPQPRIAVPAAEWTFVQDVARDGRLLLTREDLRITIWAKRKTDTAEREYAWLNYAIRGLLSRDGHQLAFCDSSQNAGPNYAVRLFDTDASTPPSRLGDGVPMAFSPDGKWVLSFVGPSEQRVLYPTGPGETKKLASGPIQHHRATRESAAWLSDGKEFLFCGTEAGRPPRCYRQRVDGGEPTAISEEGFGRVILASDDRLILLRKVTGEFVLGSLADRTTRPARGLTSLDIPLSWSRDNRSLFVQAGRRIPVRIDRVDPYTGTRTPAGQFAPPDRAGLILVGVTQWIDDGAASSYGAQRNLSKLFVASGLRIPSAK